MKILTKQVSLCIGLEDWKMLRHEAARQGLPLSQLVLMQLIPYIEKLRERDDAIDREIEEDSIPAT